MKFWLTILLSFVLSVVANATLILDKGTNNFYVTNNVTTGSTIVTNNVTNTIAAGAFVVSNNAFGAASFTPQIFYTGVTNVILTGGLTGSLTNGVLTVDGSTAALGVAAPTSGTYVAQSKNGVITWEPVSATISTSYNSTVWSTQWGVTNVFTVQGRTTQTWTWGGGTTTILIKAWGGGCGHVPAGNPGSGGFIYGLMTVTNQMSLSIIVGYGGQTSLTAYVVNTNTASWPGGGVYNTNSTTHRGAGGGCSLVYHGTNLILVAAGGGDSNSASTVPSGGWPNGAGYFSTSGGTQTGGGVNVGTGSEPGSYLQGGNTTNSTLNTQACGGCGYYGGASSTQSGGNIGGGGGSSYCNPVYFLWIYGTVGVNSGDINYSSSYGSASGGAVGNNGAILIITPTP